MEQIAHDDWMAADQEEEKLAQQASSEYARVLKEERGAGARGNHIDGAPKGTDANAGSAKVKPKGAGANASSANSDSNANSKGSVKFANPNSTANPKGGSAREKASSEQIAGEIVTLSDEDGINEEGIGKFNERIVNRDSDHLEPVSVPAETPATAAAANQGKSTSIDPKLANEGISETPSLSFTDFMRKQVGQKK
jgi:hypothetical protein